eukprot:TRINITY_DN447_c0_g1_i1.p2 TRINITY_DN447_c0_g1~~TRINITY_DN447_c0_g1_i1.p2  ORF type:complete len:132 (-),score=32.30 TRINITY_DN447_c0_g1_i1:620-1015(-)
MLGVDEFVDGGYWGGELYVDKGKESYKALQLKSAGILGALNQIFLNRKVKKFLEKTKNVPGNLAGDGLQLGATLVIGKDGNVLMDFRQETFADHPTPEEILEALGIDPRKVVSEEDVPPGGERCDDVACER